jgi:hypothetical protein
MNSKTNLYFLTAVLLCCSTIQSFSQTTSKNYSSEITAARRQVIETHQFKIKKLDLGLVSLGENRFTALVKNKTKSPLVIGLDLATQPGLWVRKRFQQQFIFQINPGEEKQIEATYKFRSMTPEAYLSVGFGIPILKGGGDFEIKDFIFEKRYYVGRGNKSIDYDGSNFKKYETEHFEIYYYKGSLAEREINEIVRGRESAFREISDLLGIKYDRKIRLVFYPDAETKKKEIGHIGDGYAFSNNIVEVYNEKTKLDPFHELAHILAGKLGDPPAMFNEGFAVYVSEKLGSDALRYLGSPGKTIDVVTGVHYREGKLFKLEELLRFTEIGSEESKPEISYPEAASVVKYLVETYGLQKFRQLYQQAKNSSRAAEGLKNKEILKEIYGKPLSEIEQEWLNKNYRQS